MFFCLFSSLLLCKTVTINADELSYNDKEKKSYANGHAFAVLTEDNKKQTLKADNLVIFHSQEKNHQEDNNIERIEAMGNVEFKSESLLLVANKCIYEKKNKQIICTGCVNIKDQVKNYEMQGDEGIFDLENETYFVKKDAAQKEQVHAMFLLGK
jgi:lipopolysaccharide transport protein LptA